MNNQNRNELFWVPLLLVLYNFCANLANDIYLPCMPLLEHQFETSSRTLQLTMTAWFAGIAFPQLFFGPLSDRYGRRCILLNGGVCFLIASIVCAFSNSIGVLILGRFFQGVGVCSLNVATFTILSDRYDFLSRTKIINKINRVGIIAPLLGPILGGYILMYCGWRINFILIFFMGLFSVTGLWLTLSESNHYLNLEATKVKRVFKNYGDLLKNKIFLKHLVPYSLLLGGLIVYLTAAPFVIIEKLNIPVNFFGVTQLPIFGAYILGSFYLSTIKSEAAIRQLLTKGMMLVLLAGIMMVGMSYLIGNHLLSFIAPMVLYAVGFSFCGSPLVNEVMSSATEAKGSAAAILGFGMALSCMLSSLLLGFIYNGTILVIGSLMGIIAMLAASLYFYRGQEAASRQNINSA